MASNISPATATRISALPFDLTVSAAALAALGSGVDYPSTCDSTQQRALWWIYRTRPGQRVLSVNAQAANESSPSFDPYLSIWTGSSLAQYAIGAQHFCEGLTGDNWLLVPVEPETDYLLQVVNHNGADIVDADLLVRVRPGPDLSVPVGALVVNDDTDGFPAAVFGVDGEFRTYAPIPAGEFADTLADGTTCWQDGEADHGIAILDVSFNVIARLDFGVLANVFGIKSNRTDTFYVVIRESGTTRVQAVSAAGVLGDAWTLPVGSANDGVFAVARDGSVFYSGQRNLNNKALHAYDLVHDTALPDLHAGFAGESLYGAGDGYVAADGSIVFAYVTFGGSGIGGTVRRFAPDGTVLDTIVLGGHLTYLNHFAFANDDPGQVAVWGGPSIGLSTAYFQLITLDGGAVTESPAIKVSGQSGGSQEAPFFISNCCPLLVIQAAPACECCMATKLEVINDALSKIGITRFLTQAEIDAADAGTPGSPEALLGSLHYPKALKETLRAYPWPFATKYAASDDAGVGDPMELVDGDGQTPVNGDWMFAYRYPDDCLKARRILPAGAAGTGRQFNANPVPFRVGRTTQFGADADYLLVFTNLADAVLEYTALVECREDFADALFEDALAWLLASKFSPGLERAQKTAQDCYTMFLTVVNTARAVAQSEGQLEPDGDAGWIGGR